VTAPPDWAERGRELGATLGACHAVVVVGSDPVATAEVAIGIGRVQSPSRRVAIADLIGEVAPLQSLVVGDDPHGIVDSFVFGVSLNKIAHAVADAGQLFVMPSGASPIAHEELLPNPRWKRLSGGFRAEGALLLLVAPADAPRLKDLVDATDGVVIVGDSVPADIPVAQSLAWLRTRRSARPSLAGASPLALIQETKARPRQRRLAAAGGVAITIGLAAAVIWFAARPIASGPRPVRAVSKPTPDAPATKTVLAPDSTRRDTLRADGVAELSPLGAGALLIANAGDSARAAEWSVVLGQTSTPAAAILDLRGRYETVPSGTYQFDARTHVFSLVAGAFQTRASADSLLAQLRLRKVLAAQSGTVTTLPFAFLVQADVPAAEVPERLRQFSARGQPVYALRQPGGTAHLYFGAYENPRVAMLAESSVRSAGFVPTLAYRIGRVF
jgi:hypothetical protein